jgi:heme oxygenase
MKMTGRRARLRVATTEAHARLDALIDEAGFFEDRLRYAVYLQATWRARQQLELALDTSAVEMLFPAWPKRRISAALCADSADIGKILQPSEDDSVCPPPSYEPAEALGVLYVLEGSALGARLLAPRAERLGLTPSFGARHFAVQLSMPHAWPAFLAILEAASLDVAEERACIEAAIATFMHFERVYRSATAR